MVPWPPEITSQTESRSVNPSGMSHGHGEPKTAVQYVEATREDSRTPGRTRR